MCRCADRVSRRRRRSDCPTWGDGIGMTAAAEADLCSEIGILNSLAIVDNPRTAEDGDDSGNSRSSCGNQPKVNGLRAKLEILG